jgi:hypothetical protein
MTTREEQKLIWANAYAQMTPDQRRVADDILKRGGDNAGQQLQWAEELVALVDLLAAREPGEAPWLVVRMFWIRLHGIVTELVEAHSATSEMAATMTEHELARSLVRFSVRIFNAAKAVLAIMEESEVVVVDYLRQRAVHLRQKGYSLRFGKNGVLDQRRVGQLQKTFSIEDIDRMRVQMLRLHGSEAAFARRLADKIQPAAVKLLEVLRAFHELPPM